MREGEAEEECQTRRMTLTFVLRSGHADDESAIDQERTVDNVEEVERGLRSSRRSRGLGVMVVGRSITISWVTDPRFGNGTRTSTAIFVPQPLLRIHQLSLTRSPRYPIRAGPRVSEGRTEAAERRVSELVELSRVSLPVHHCSLS